MSIFICRKYITALAPRLERFTSKGNDTWSFRCPLCGDSKKSKNKVRGNLYRRKNEMFYRCFNCSVSTTFGKLLSDVAPELYKQFKFDMFVASKGDNVPDTKNDDIEALRLKMKQDNERLKDLSLDGLVTPIDQLNKDHFARQYVESRKIPQESWKYLSFASNFKQVVLRLNESRAKDIPENEPRLLISTLGENGELTGVAARSFQADSKQRYIHIKTSDVYPKIFGLDKIKTFNGKIYVFEGPIDSMFFPNSLATCDADLSFANIFYQDIVLVFDNQPRNSDLVKTVKRSIEKGFRVCLFPDSMPFKDINEMIMGGMSLYDINNEIESHIYEGISAELEFTRWKKI